MKKRSKYPPHPQSNWCYATRHTASINLKKPNKLICIYCHGQCVKGPIPHQPDCPAKNVKE